VFFCPIIELKMDRKSRTTLFTVTGGVKKNAPK